MFPCDGYKDRGSEKVCEGVKKKTKQICWIKIGFRKLILIKHTFRIQVGIKHMVIDDFTYAFVRNLLHGDGEILTGKFIVFL